MSKIMIEHLKYKYPLTDMLALDDISLSIETGEFIGIAGKNSSGKSTLCQALVGLVPHFYKGGYGGRILIDGIEVINSTISEMALKVGLVFQNPFTQITGSKLTVFDEVGFGLENLGIPHNEMIERINEALKILNIEDFKERNPFDLSGGQMQRMAIASIIAMKPNIIVLDEPTSQLDPQGAEEVFKSITTLREQGLTIIMVEHKIEKLAHYCDKIAVLDSGKLVAFEKPSSLFSRSDLTSLGIPAPVYTRICTRLGIKTKPESTNITNLQNDFYPVTLQEASYALGGKNY